MNKPSNPPLFENDGTPHSQVTLRDLFAAFALTGLLAGQMTKGEDLAADAYEAAEDMLKERERKP